MNVSTSIREVDTSVLSAEIYNNVLRYLCLTLLPFLYLKWTSFIHCEYCLDESFTLLMVIFVTGVLLCQV